MTEYHYRSGIKHFTAGKIYETHRSDSPCPLPIFSLTEYGKKGAKVIGEVGRGETVIYLEGDLCTGFTVLQNKTGLVGRVYFHPNELREIVTEVFSSITAEEKEEVLPCPGP